VPRWVGIHHPPSSAISRGNPNAEMWQIQHRRRAKCWGNNTTRKKGQEREKSAGKCNVQLRRCWKMSYVANKPLYSENEWSLCSTLPFVCLIQQPPPSNHATICISASNPLHQFQSLDWVPPPSGHLPVLPHISLLPPRPITIIIFKGPTLPPLTLCLIIPRHAWCPLVVT